MEPLENINWRLGEILVQQKWITWEQLEKAIQMQQESRRALSEVLLQNKMLSKDNAPVLNLGEILIRHGWIQWDQLKKALEIQKETKGLVGEILVNQGVLTPANLLRALAIQAGKKFVDLKAINISRDALKLVPKRLAIEFCFIPLVENEGHLLIAVSKPQDIRPESELQRILPNYEVATVIATAEDIQAAIQRAYESYTA